MADDMPACGACLTRAHPSAVHACVASVDYAYPWDRLIARFKFQGEPGWARVFAREMLGQERARDLLGRCALMVPVPLTASRLARRGHNQAWELAKAVRRQGRHMGLPLPAQACADALVRLRETPDQHSLTREQRLRNLDGVFAAHPRRTPQIRGQHVLLMDDVSTTGATLDAAAQALLQAGASRVSAMVFARTG